LTFVATIADLARFDKSRTAGAFLGLRPRQQQSGSKNPQLGIAKADDSYLRTLLVQCAHGILSSRGEDTALKRWGLRLCERGGSNAKKRAVVAVARKLAVLLHKLWVSGQSYKPFPVAS
jgi:transposase